MLIRINENQYFNSDHVVRIVKFKDGTVIEMLRGNDFIIENATPQQIVALIRSHHKNGVHHE